jgi:hypothetical protein
MLLTFVLAFVTVIAVSLYDVYRLYIQNFPTRRLWFELVVGLLYAISVAWLAHNHTLWHELRYRWQDVWMTFTVHEFRIQSVLWGFFDALGDNFPLLEPVSAFTSRWVIVRKLMLVLTAVPLFRLRRYLTVRIKVGLQILRILLVRTWYWLLSYVTIAIATIYGTWWQPYVEALIIWVAGAFKQIESLPKLLSSLTAHEGLKFPGQLHGLKAYLNSCLDPSQPNTWLVVFLIIIPIILRGVDRILIDSHPTCRTSFERIVGVLCAFVFAWMTDADEIRRQFFMAVEALHDFGQPKWHAIQEWNSPMTEEKAEDTLGKFKTDRTPPPEAPPPADGEPAFEPSTQPEAPTPTKDLPIPKELLKIHSNAKRKNKILQQKIEAVHPKKAAPKYMVPIVKSPAAESGTINASTC